MRGRGVRKYFDFNTWIKECRAAHREKEDAGVVEYQYYLLLFWSISCWWWSMQWMARRSCVSARHAQVTHFSNFSNFSDHSNFWTSLRVVCAGELIHFSPFFTSFLPSLLHSVPKRAVELNKNQKNKKIKELSSHQSLECTSKRGKRARGEEGTVGPE